MKHQNEFHVLCHWDWLVFQHGLGRCVWFLVGKKGGGRQLFARPLDPPAADTPSTQYFLPSRF